ncbi:MAG: glycine cleavage system protein H, partial [Gammaproteobacteria bacterium]|nr:glycine cleavage system protein H [Gammaproteobacteria bacterium]
VVTEANEALADEPQLVNEQPYDDGWIMKMQPSSLDDVNDLMDADEYEASLADEDDGPIDNEDD